MTESSVKKMRKWSVLIILLILVTGAISWAFALNNGNTNDMIIADNADTETTNQTTPSEPNVPDVAIPEATEPEKVKGESEKPEHDEVQPSNPTEPEVEMPEVEVPEVVIPSESEIDDDTNVSEEPEVSEEKHEHAYASNVIAATCENAGYTEHTCECGDSYIDNYTEILNHSWSQWYVAQEPTTAKEGIMERECNNCDTVETYAIEKIVETHTHSYVASVVEPTCEEDGYTMYTCICGYGYVGNTTDATGHTYESTVVNPTCNNGGYTINVCSECGNSYTDKKTDALKHEVSQWNTTEAATCEANGVERRDCTRCDYYETRDIEAIGHSYESVITAPTCTQNGYTTYTCSVCDDTYTADKIEKYGHKWQEATCATAKICTTCGTTEGEIAGHDYESVVTAPTCTERGYTTYTCHCGNNYIDNYVNANGHEMGEWKTVTRSGCIDDGKEVRYCNNCDHSESRIVESVGHNYNAVSTVAATCTTDGYTTYACACGDSYTADVVAAPGHNYESEVVAPTYESKGYTIHTCSNCGDSYKDNYVDALIPEDEEEEGCGEHKGCCGHHDAHRHKEVKIGKYLYVYCDHVTSIYRSADGLIIFYPYELYN